MAEDQPARRQNWRSHVNELLRHLHRGPALTSANLHSLQITLQKPVPIVPSPAVIEQIPLFLDSDEGKEWICSRHFAFRELEKGTDRLLKEQDLRDLTARLLMSSAEKMGEDRFWRDNNQNEKNWITPVLSDSTLLVSVPRGRKTRSGKTPAFRYDTRALIETVSPKKIPVLTAVISHGHNACPSTLSPAEVFCLVALAIRSSKAHPTDSFYHVRVFATDSNLQFRCLRARIPISYISSLLQSNDKLVNGFVIEQTEYVNIFSDNGLRDSMSAMFECWP